MNAVVDFNISPSSLQSIVDQSISDMLQEVLANIELEINGHYSELFTKREQILKNRLSQEDFSIYEHLEDLWIQWASDQADAAIKAGLIIAQRLALPLPVQSPETSGSEQ